MMEHFDESMVLLKRRLCWSIDDIVFFKTNERLNKNKRRVLTTEQEDSIKKWNNADIALYDYFVDKFWKEIEKEGSEFYDDLQELKSRKKYYFNACVAKETVTEAYSSVYVKGYEMRKNLTSEMKLFCERMLRNELLYQDYFKSKYAKKVSNLEAETIENFDDQFEEAEVNVEEGSLWGKEGKSYDYGLPTKNPRPPPSRATVHKRFRAERGKKKAIKSKTDATAKRKNEQKKNGKEAKKDDSIQLNNKVTKTSKNQKEQEVSSGLNPNNDKNTNEKKRKTTSPTNEPQTTAPTIPITLEKYKKDKLMTLENHMKELDRTTEEITKSTEAPLIHTEAATDKFTTEAKSTVNRKTVNALKPTPERGVKKNKKTIIPETNVTPTTRIMTKAAEDYIRYTKQTEEMESSNKKLEKDDPKRYDGKTIVASRTSHGKN